MSDLDKVDLTKGVALESIPDGSMLLGVVGEEEVLLVRRGAEFFAVGAHCTHYHGPLADGLVVGDEVRCPWHHACFSLRTGMALRAQPRSDRVLACGAGGRHHLRERESCKRHTQITAAA